jgi:DNA-binding CsgD family transcriptional regulator
MRRRRHGGRQTYRAPVTRAQRDRQTAEIAALSSLGLDSTAFRSETLRRLRALVSIDAAFFATVDPVTLLFTSAVAEEPLGTVAPLFLENEFGQDDVNKFASLASSTDRVGSLDRATRGDRASSLRYRNVMAPLGLGDELRVALMAGGQCWGVLCLHREDAPLGFSGDEIDLVRRLGPHLGEGLRRGLTFSSASDAAGPEGPGIIILGADLAVMSINAQADRWLGEIAGEDWPNRSELPVPILAAAAQLAGDGRQTVPAAAPTRLRSTRGVWITVRASPLHGPAGRQIAVILELANPRQLSSLVLAAHGLTPAQQRVVALVLQGRSTRGIIDELQISSHTLQEHLRGVFEKFGIGSRRELVATLSGHRG